MSVPSEPSAHDDYLTTEELVRRHGASPLRSVAGLADDDPFASDEEYADFLRDLYDSRRAPAP